MGIALIEPTKILPSPTGRKCIGAKRHKSAK
jgi:hypothetical protein